MARLTSVRVTGATAGAGGQETRMNRTARGDRAWSALVAFTSTETVTKRAAPRSTTLLTGNGSCARLLPRPLFPRVVNRIPIHDRRHQPSVRHRDLHLHAVLGQLALDAGHA